MTEPRRLLAHVVFGALIIADTHTDAQVFSATTAPAQNWVSLASSADGVRLAAVASYGGIYLSTNSGATWTAATTMASGPEPERPWVGMSSSADGRRLVAVANFNPIFTSTNGGVTWTQSGPATTWSSVAASSDGMKIFATDHDMGQIYLSIDGGSSWESTSAPNRRWRSMAVSANGTRLAAATDFGASYGDAPSIYTSTNSGNTWTLTTAPGNPWQTIVSSADGTKLAAGAYGGLIYLSSDFGVTWRPANVPALHWSGIASSTDGSRLVAAAWEGVVYLSADSGQTWSKAIAPAAPWQTVASSADGERLFAGIWDDSDGGIYAAQLPPSLNISPVNGGTVVSWSSSATGYALQQSSNLGQGKWQPVSAAPALVRGQNQIMIPSTNENCAYRLVKVELTQ